MNDRVTTRMTRKITHERRLRLRAERSLRRLWESKRVRAAWEMEQFAEAVKEGKVQRMLANAARLKVE